MSETEPPARPLTLSERTRQELEKVQIGQRLCIVGRGTDNFVHKHRAVSRLTKLYIVTEFTNSFGTHEDRFRRDSGRSVPYSDYGGTSAHTTCQRPKKDS